MIRKGREWTNNWWKSPQIRGTYHICKYNLVDPDWPVPATVTTRINYDMFRWSLIISTWTFTNPNVLIQGVIKLPILGDHTIINGSFEWFPPIRCAFVWVANTHRIHVWYCIFTYIYHKNQANDVNTDAWIYCDRHETAFVMAGRCFSCYLFLAWNQLGCPCLDKNCCLKGIYGIYIYMYIYDIIYTWCKAFFFPALVVQRPLLLVFFRRDLFINIQGTIVLMAGLASRVKFNLNHLIWSNFV